MQGFGFTISVLLGFTAFGFRGAGCSCRGLRFRFFSALGFRGAGFRVLGF